MMIEWIGTGSGLNPTLGNTSFIVRAGDDRTLLVDCGGTVPLALIKKGYIAEITDVILTHAHADHIGGLEGLAFMHYFALKNRGDKRLNLHVATDSLAHILWHRSLRGGMEKIQTDQNEPMDATLETFFKVNVGKEVVVEGFPKAVLFSTPHVQGLENYGLKFPEIGVFYSGDTLEKPPIDFNTIFQDCQFYETPADVHISYDKLLGLDSATRKKTYLVHLGGGWDKKLPKKDGFAGFVNPGDIFTL